MAGDDCEGTGRKATGACVICEGTEAWVMFEGFFTSCGMGLNSGEDAEG